MSRSQPAPGAQRWIVRQLNRRGLAPAVFVALATLTVAVAAGLRASAEAEARERLAGIAAGVESLIAERLGAFEGALEGLALLAAERAPDAESWRRHANATRAIRGMAGANAILWVEALAGERFVVRYAEPAATGERLIGLDLARDPDRRTVARTARASGAAQLTPPVRLLDVDPRPSGVALLVPVYAPARQGAGLPRAGGGHRGHDGVDAARGFVYGSIDAARFFAALTRAHAEYFHLSVIDVAGATLYDSRTARAGDEAPVAGTGRHSLQRRLPVVDRSWTLRFESTPAFDASVHSQVPVRALLGGLLVSAAFALLVALLAHHGRRMDALALELDDARSRSERRYQALVDMLPIGVFETDAGGRPTFANRRHAQTHGLDPGAAPGTGGHAGIDERDRQRIAEGYERCLAARSRYHAEYRIVRPDGETRWVETVAEPRYGSDGLFAGYVGATTDITGRKQTDQAMAMARDRLLAAETRLLQAIEAVDAGFTLYDQDERLVMCNRRALEFAGASAFAMVPGASLESILRTAWRSGQAGAGAGGEDAWVAAMLERYRDAEQPFERESGERVYRIRAIRTASGELVTLRVDITELRQRERALRDSESRAALAEQRLRDALEAVDVGFALYDLDQRLVLANTRARASWGPEGQALPAGTPRSRVLDLIRGPGGAAAGPDRGTAGGGGDSEPVRQTGGRWYSVSHHRTTTGDHVVVHTDVTETRAREAELRRLAAEARDAESRLGQILDAIDGAILVFDRDNRVVYCNRHYRETLRQRSGIEPRPGMTREELLAAVFDAPGVLLPGDTVQAAIARLIEAQRDSRTVYEPRAGGLWVQIAHTRTTAGHTVVVRTDVTELKRQEERSLELARAAQSAEAQLRDVIESIDAGLVVYGPDDRVKLFNERFAQSYAAAGHRVQVGDTRRTLLEAIYRQPGFVPEGETPENMVRRRLAVDWRRWRRFEQQVGERWLRFISNLTPSGDAVMLRVDITDLKQREAEYERLSLVARHTADAVMVTGRDDAIEWVNDAFVRMTGYGLDEARGRRPSELLRGAGTDRREAQRFDVAVAAGLTAAATLLNYRRGGQPYWAEVDSRPLTDRAGRPAGRFLVARDITARREAESALRASEARAQQLARIVEEAREAVIVKDLDNRIVSWNRGASVLFGYTAEEALGQNSHRLLRGESASAATLEARLADLRSGRGERSEVRLRRKDGVWIDVEVIRSPTRDEQGRLTGQVSFAHDIGEQVAARRAMAEARQAAEQADAAKTMFFANMSHELRTPMHAILSYSRLGLERLERGPPAKLRGYLARIEQSGERLLALLNELLDLARLEAGKMPIEAGEHDLLPCLEQAIAEQAAWARQRGVTLALLSGGPWRAWFDPARIAQVLANLLSNAIRFSPHGSQVTLAIAELHGADGAPLAEVSVADQGPGIPEAELEAVFDQFIQSSRTRTAAGSSGLGLAICRELVRGHGGDIRATNNPGGGATIRFTLPRHAPQPLLAREAA
jgi:PAS domain S-box-containing protein